MISVKPREAIDRYIIIPWRADVSGIGDRVSRKAGYRVSGIGYRERPGIGYIGDIGYGGC